MEQHPIPQDVTGFQFRLIGSMTVKQFAYVAVGVVSAVIMYYLPFSGFLGFLMKAFFIPLLGGSGFALAFLPIEGRPIDLMIGNFIRALFSPNQFVYHKEGRHLMSAPRVIAQQKPAPHPIVNKEQQLQQLLQKTHIQPHTKLDDREQLFLNEIATTPLGTPTTIPAPIQPLTNITPQPVSPVQQQQIKPIQQPPMPPPQQQGTVPPINEPEPSSQPASDKQQQPIQTPVTEVTSQSSPQDHFQLLQKQIEEIQQKNKQLQEELAHLKTKQQAPQPPVQQSTAPQNQPMPQQVISQSQTQPQPTTPGQPVQPIIQYVRNIPKELLQQAGLTHLPDTPNVAIGIVKDARGNVLPNMLVEIKDTQGNPVRAFKTNPLGQFASATPLSPGVYTIELEDPKKQHNFDIIQFTANNQIMLPMEIISHDARDELRKQLFS